VSAKDKIRAHTLRQAKARKLPRKSKIANDPARLAMTSKERNAKFVQIYKTTGDIIQAGAEARLSQGEAKMLVQSHPELREDIISLLNRLGCTPERIVTEMRRIAFSDPRQLVDAGGKQLPLHQWPEDFARAISGMDVTHSTELRDGEPVATETTYKPRLWDKGSQLKELAKMQAIAGSDGVRVGNQPGETFRGDGTETREAIMLSLLALVTPTKDPKEPV